MAAAALEHDLDRIRVRRHRADVVADRAVGQRPGVQGERIIRFGEAREQAVGQHRLRAGDGFLGRLGDEHQGAAPLRLHAHQRARRCQPGRHVDVVAAAVGGEAFAAFAGGFRATGVGQAGLFFHRQAIEFGTHHHGRAGAVLVDRHDTGLADLFGHREAELAHFRRQLAGGAGFLERQFRVRVQVLVDAFQRGPGAVHAGGNLGFHGGRELGLGGEGKGEGGGERGGEGQARDHGNFLIDGNG